MDPVKRKALDVFEKRKKSNPTEDELNSMDWLESKLNENNLNAMLLFFENKEDLYLWGGKAIMTYRLISKDIARVLLNANLWKNITEYELPLYFKYCESRNEEIMRYHRNGKLLELLVKLYSPPAGRFTREQLEERFFWFLSYQTYFKFNVMDYDIDDTTISVTRKGVAGIVPGHDSILVLMIADKAVILPVNDTIRDDDLSNFIRDTSFKLEMFREGAYALSRVKNAAYQDGRYYIATGDNEIVVIPESDPEMYERISTPIRASEVSNTFEPMTISISDGISYHAFIRLGEIPQFVEYPITTIKGLREKTYNISPYKPFNLCSGDRPTIATLGRAYVFVEGVRIQDLPTIGNYYSRTEHTAYFYGEGQDDVLYLKDASFEESNTYGNFELAITTDASRYYIARRWVKGVPDFFYSMKAEALTVENFISGCASCGKTADFKCPCGVKYCSTICQEKSFEKHIEFC